MVKHSQLDDADVAEHAWRRYRRLVLWMASAGAITAIVTLTFLHIRHPDASIHMFIAAAGGVFVSVLLGAALMGLVFLSAGTGHDDAIEDPTADEWED